MRKAAAALAIAVLMAVPLASQQIAPRTAHLRSWTTRMSEEEKEYIRRLFPNLPVFVPTVFVVAFEGKIYTLEGPGTLGLELEDGVGKDYPASITGDVMTLTVPEGAQTPKETKFVIAGASEKAEGCKQP